MFRSLSLLSLALVVALFTVSTVEAQQRRSNNRRSQVQRRSNNNRTFRSQRQMGSRVTTARSRGVRVNGRQQNYQRGKYSSVRSRTQGMNKAHNQTSGSGAGTIHRPRPRPRPNNTAAKPKPRPRGGSTSPRPRGHGSGGTAPPDGVTPGRIPRYHNK